MNDNELQLSVGPVKVRPLTIRDDIVISRFGAILLDDAVDSKKMLATIEGAFTGQGAIVELIDGIWQTLTAAAEGATGDVTSETRMERALYGLLAHLTGLSREACQAFTRDDLIAYVSALMASEEARSPLAARLLAGLQDISHRWKTLATAISAIGNPSEPGAGATGGMSDGGGMSLSPPPAIGSAASPPPCLGCTDPNCSTCAPGLAPAIS